MEPDPLKFAQAAMGLELLSQTDDRITHALGDPQFSGCFDAEIGAIEDAPRQLIGLASEFSVAPISGFQVGAVAYGKSGKVYLGTNMEFNGVPLHATLHAEQSALINAWMHGEPAIRSLHTVEPPCGHCRQFLQELHRASDLTLLVQGAARNLAELLPEPFAQNRSKGQGLLDSPSRPLVGIHKDKNNHVQRAINAASRSYCPYSQSPEGFLIETINGQFFAGRTAESIAFNPTVPAVVAALNQMNLSAQRKVSISRCTHARLATAITQSFAFSESVMRGICNLPIQSVLMESAD